MDITFQPLGDTAVRVHFNESVSPQLNKKIQHFCRALINKAIEGVIECVPAYDSVVIYYTPNKLSYHSICEKIDSISLVESQHEEEKRRVLYIPTYYGGELGPDLERVATYNQITEEEVIRIHSSTNYLVHMMGFLPGFPYMGGLSAKITTPRLDNPRLEVPGGTVAIAGEQTVIYSLDSPGGANLIGHTPVQLVNMMNDEPFLFHPGDIVRFESVTEAEYESIKREVKNKTYRMRKDVGLCATEIELI